LNKYKYSMNTKRFRRRNAQKNAPGPVLYWMGRDQRVADNWALLAAAQLAQQAKSELHVLFVMPAAFIGASARHYDFLIRGLEEVEQSLRAQGIAFHVRCGEPPREVVQFVNEFGIGAVVMDANPLRIVEQWKQQVSTQLEVACIEVDAHNVVPVWQASPKQEIGARTLRPKINAALPEFLEEFPQLTLARPSKSSAVDWQAVREYTRAVAAIPPITWCEPGEAAAARELTAFITQRLPGYAMARNDVSRDGQSRLSPYLHFGQLSPQRVALAVQASDAPEEDKEAYLEELIIRRELSDNFTFYNPHYDSFAGAPAWALKSLAEHQSDARPVLYSYEQLEAAATHDPFWNAAQRQLIEQGKIHGYMRMFWAKQVLLWTPDAATAHAYVLRLNDTYSIDGNDPNGYVGVLWSVAGLHDRPWVTRPIFGAVRFMNKTGVMKRGGAALLGE
jgi:deoxyribodipyrimidine photo-lyase